MCAVRIETDRSRGARPRQTRVPGGRGCCRSSFETTGADWQVWLEQGDRPLPRRLAVTLVNAPGEPEYLTVIKRWQFDPDLNEGLFRFEPPADWRRIEISKLPPPQDQ
jgi:hypothetical protein